LTSVETCEQPLNSTSRDSKHRQDTTLEFRKDSSLVSVFEGKTVTQSILISLAEVLEGKQIRLILSSKPQLNSEAFGNHFLPLHFTETQFSRLLKKNKSDWKTVLHRLGEKAGSIESALPSMDASNYLTVTSVGSLHTIESVLKRLGVVGLLRGYNTTERQSCWSTWMELARTGASGAQ
jgi:hypothetical protein